MTSVLTFKRLRAGNDSAFLTGCHGNPFRHKDHFCVRVVFAGSAPQAALVHCMKLSQRFPGWLNITLTDPLNHPFRPSYQQQRGKNTTTAEVPGESVWLFQSAAFTNDNVLSVTDGDLLKITLLGTEISTSGDIFLLCAKWFTSDVALSFLWNAQDSTHKHTVLRPCTCEVIFQRLEPSLTRQ